MMRVSANAWGSSRRSGRSKLGTRPPTPSVLTNERSAGVAHAFLPRVVATRTVPGTHALESGDVVRVMLDDAAMRLLGVAFTSSIAAAALIACGRARLPAPNYVRQPPLSLVEVPYPPPPARVEYVPDQPDRAAVWLDGEWVWQGRRYAWKPGRWVRPPANASFAPWTTVRNTIGMLYMAEGTWRDRDGNEIAPPDPLTLGSPRPGAIIGPRGEALAIHGVQSPEASTAKPDAALSYDTRAPHELIVDSGPDLRVDASQLPEGSLEPEPSDASILPDVAGFDATFDAEPARMSKP